MSTIEKRILVDVPVHTAYDRWTRFESFPEFMEGVESVEKVGDRRLHWKADIGGVTKEWDAEIVEQVPDERVAWRAVQGTKNDGEVSFAPDRTGSATQVTLRIDYEPEGFVEKAGDKLDIVEQRAQADLMRFKQSVESRRHEAGPWQG